MREKLTIRNFGPIDVVDIELGSVNVFIGDQGTGKSTIAKLLFCLKACGHNYTSNASFNGVSLDSNNHDEFNARQTESFFKDFIEIIKAWDLYNYINSNTYIQYDCSSFHITYDNHILKGDYKVEFKKNNEYSVFIPASRESYILLKDKYPTLMNADIQLPRSLNLFGQHFNNYTSKSKHYDFRNILEVEYENLNGKDQIFLKGGQVIKFEEASSAVNSLLPLLIVFDGIVHQSSDQRYFSQNKPMVIIEEPELNCFPETQKKVVDHLIGNSKTKKDFIGEELVNIFITTHSPYILTSLNNLMGAYKAGQIDRKATNKIIPEIRWLNPDNVSAYLLRDGKAENIMNYQEGVIQTQKIDTVTAELNEEFDKIFNIELRLNQ